MVSKDKILAVLMKAEHEPINGLLLISFTIRVIRVILFERLRSRNESFGDEETS